MSNNKYRKSFLKEVIVKIDFSSSIDEFNQQLPSKLTNVILQRFPISEPEPKKVIARELQITPETVKTTSNEESHWIFHDKEKEKVSVITPKSFYISYKKYYSFDLLNEDFLLILNELFGVYPNIRSRMFALRYINEINIDEINPLDWNNYLKNNLLSIFNIPVTEGKICRAFHNLSINYGEWILKFQYGMHNPDFPASIRKKVFILDYDAIYQGIQDKGDIENLIPLFHEKIQNLFESSISDALREKMEVIHG